MIAMNHLMFKKVAVYLVMDYIFNYLTLLDDVGDRPVVGPVQIVALLVQGEHQLDLPEGGKQPT